jgi:PST family polysaccharide transporter
MTEPSLRRGTAHLLSGQWVKYALQLATLVLLSRLLPPEEFGLVTMVMVIVGIATVLGDFGLSLAAIREPNLTAGEHSNLFWVNGAVGGLLAAAAAASAPLIGLLYDEPRLVPLAAVVAVTFFLNGLTVQFKVELFRRKHLSQLAAIDVASQAAALLVAVVAALLGFGAWALVAQSVVFAGGGLIGSAVLSKWLPGWWDRDARLRPFLRFGGFTSLAQIMNYAATNVGPLMIGLAFGPQVIALFNRAFQIAALPVQQLAPPLTRVIVPQLAAQAGDRDRFAQGLLKASRMTVYPLLAILSLLATTATPLIPLLLGEAWADSVPFLLVLALGTAFQAMAYPFYWGMVADGRAGLLLLLELPGRLITIALAVAVTPFGPTAVAATWSVGLVVVWILEVTIALPRLAPTRRPLLAVTLRAFAVFGLPAGVGVSLQVSGVTGSDVLSFIVLGAVWVALVLLALVHPAVRLDVRVVMDAVRKRQIAPE